jgi:hypothetical protein
MMNLCILFEGDFNEEGLGTVIVRWWVPWGKTAENQCKAINNFVGSKN